MVERAGHCTHRPDQPPYLDDEIQVFVASKLIDKAFFERKYRQSNATVAQIAEEMGLCRTTVLKRLADSGVRSERGRERCPENFRAHNPPFGYRVSSGRLVPDRTQMKVIRFIVELRDRRDLTLQQVAAELNARGYRNRQGKLWHHYSVGLIHKRWTGKL